MGIIIFNNKSSKDYDIMVEKMPDYEIAEKDYDIIHIPGRNGDILVDKGSYKNVPRRYQLSIGSLEKDFTYMAIKLSEWLQSTGYSRLEDSYEPNYYRLAMYQDSGTIENILESAGKITISFNCKPQRFLKSGEKKTIFLNNGTIYNYTNFDSLPIIIVNGIKDGEIRIGKYTIIISSIDSSLTINSEIQDVYTGTINKNSTINLINGYPKLIPGENEISFSGGITSLEVIPKWWTL